MYFSKIEKTFIESVKNTLSLFSCVGMKARPAVNTLSLNFW